VDFSRFQLISFDCYGTLIDWECGILRAVQSAFPGLSRSNADILGAYSEIEGVIQAGAYKPYRVVLRAVLAAMARRFGQAPVNPDALADSVKNWKPFPETVSALEKLKLRYKLAIISNIDDDLFAATASHLRTSFDHVITSQQVGSYKPSLRNFEVALERTKLRKESVLHVAESLFHDIAPARQLGIPNVWVNRRAGKSAAASKLADVEPDLTVPDLKSLVDLSCLGL
jgi:2-haloacid dehalogenase